MEDEFPNVYGAAYVELARRFGGTFRTRFTVVAAAGVGTPVQLCQADAERVFLLLGNVGAGNVSIGPTAEIALTGAMVVAPVSDRSWTLSDHATLPTEAWFQNAAVGSGLAVLEVRRESIVKRRT